MKPILFSAEMVRAILDGRKSQTRRVIKEKEQDSFCQTETGIEWWTGFFGWQPVDLSSPPRKSLKCPYGEPGDELWVRESIYNCGDSIAYCADDSVLPMSNWPWKKDKLPSIFMPFGASRITLIVKSVRVERIQDISEADVYAEGISSGLIDVYGGGYTFRAAWDRINAKRGFSWDANPWVFAIEFEVKE